MALVLTRKLMESVWVDRTRITVIRVGDGRVQLRFEAPENAKVMREELLVEGKR